MALIQDASTTWSDPVTLEQDEIWQARSGSVFVSTSSGPSADDGLALNQREGLRLSAGLVVRYRKAGTTSALIVREAV